MLLDLAVLDKIAYRKIDILKLLASQTPPCSANNLSEKLNISGKTLVSYLTELETCLTTYQSHVQLINTKEGYYLSKKNFFSMKTTYKDQTEPIFYWNSSSLENDWANLIEALQNLEKQKIGIE